MAERRAAAATRSRWRPCAPARSSTGIASRRTCGPLPGLDGPFEVLQFPNGSANLTYLVRIGDHRSRRSPAAVRTARARRPRHAPRVPRRRRPVASLRPGRRTPTCSATTTTSSAPTSSSSSTAGASSCGTTCPTSMAHHADAAHRIGTGGRRRPRRAAPPRPRRRSGSATSAAPPGSSSARCAAGASAGTSSTPGRVPADAAGRRAPRRHDPAMATGAVIGAAQRLQDRQLPVRSGRP